MEAEIATQAVGLASSTDFSLMNHFLRADIVVKSVIIILILASIYSWALIFDKYRLFKRIQKVPQFSKINFGIQNLPKVFIIIFQAKLKILWQIYLGLPWLN